MWFWQYLVNLEENYIFGVYKGMILRLVLMLYFNKKLKFLYFDSMRWAYRVYSFLFLNILSLLIWYPIKCFSHMVIFGYWINNHISKKQKVPYLKATTNKFTLFLLPDFISDFLLHCFLKGFSFAVTIYPNYYFN